jgi:hypothetical protein
MQCLETRETILRLSPLLLVFCMLRKIGMVMIESELSAKQPTNGADTVDGSRTSINHHRQQRWINYIDLLEQNLVKVVMELLYFGANPMAKDICGRTVCFYGASRYATPRSLTAISMCIQAATSAHCFGKEIMMHNMDTTATNDFARKNVTTYNGMRGLAAGYQVETGRRIVYLFGQKSEIAVLNRNIRLVDENRNDEQNKVQTPMLNLCNLQDRLGHVCLTELVSSERTDVIKILMSKYNASIDIPDWSGQTLRIQLSRKLRGGSIGNNAKTENSTLQNVGEVGVVQMILVEAMKRARREQKRIDNTCTACSHQKPSSNKESNLLQLCQRWYVH